ncbi:MAG: hypothetical protein Q8T11_03915 [Elusimicrobiota bacterium]|nr:hypothetical protein [Elusimicrobiota bacterium]
MKSFSLVALGVIALGSLALSGCSGCSQEPEAETSSVPQTTCGPGTRKVGTECIANTTSTTNRAQPLNSNN